MTAKFLREVREGLVEGLRGMPDEYTEVGSAMALVGQIASLDKAIALVEDKPKGGKR